MRWGGHGGFDYSFEDDGKWKISNSKEGKDRKRREMIKIMYFVFCTMRRRLLCMSTKSIIEWR